MRIITITGARGVGKTTLAATAGKLENMLVLDTENSWSDLIDDGMVPAQYFRRQEAVSPGKSLIDDLFMDKPMPWAGRNQNIDSLTWDWMGKSLREGLKDTNINCVVIDTIEPIEAAMTDRVENNKALYGWVKKAYGGLETKGVRPLYDFLFESLARAGVKDLIIISHLKQPWVKQGTEQVPLLGVVTMGGRLQVLSRLSNLMIWLQKGEDPSGAPAGIVMKARTSIKTKENGIVKPRAYLPQRMPVCTWEAMEEYRKNPADLANPAPGEVIDETMLNMLSGLLTDKQMELMISTSQERRAIGEMTPNQQIAHYHELGMSPDEIAEQVGVSMPKVRRVIRSAE